jgi:PadR family transcriptional regulator PadR
LRRLETQGLLNSEWREEEKRKKRFYLLSASGALVLDQLLAEWRNLDSSIYTILKEQSHGTN